MARKISPRDIPNRVEATTQEIGGHENAKFATKVIEILNGTNFQEHIVPVLDAGVTDYWLPIPSHTMMPPELDFPPCQAIINSQWSILEKSYELNRSHIPLDTEAMSEEDGKRFPKSLTYKRYLGRGGAGIVVEVQAAGGRSFAVKRFPREAKYLEAKNQLRSIKQEIEILKKISHTHCIKFMGSYGDVDDIGVVMDPVADCNLKSFLGTFNHSEPNNRMILANFFGCLASALMYLHWEVKIRHKDIKPENILVKKDRVILTDFGISLDWSEQGHSTTHEEARRSPKYCAPEAVREEPRNRKSDIWSLGCVFLEMSAVLRGLSSGYVGTVLKDRGCQNFRDCPEGIRDAISAVRERGASDDYNPLELEWIEQMLQLENEKRWNSKELQLAISQSRSNPPFCGICCNRSEPTWHSRIPTCMDGAHVCIGSPPFSPVLCTNA
jgi:serine/threonine protein kinase